jgi:hypothetical protein
MGINAFVALTMSQGGSKSKQALAASFVAGVLLVVEVRMHTPYQPTTDRLPLLIECASTSLSSCAKKGFVLTMRMPSNCLSTATYDSTGP